MKIVTMKCVLSENDRCISKGQNHNLSSQNNLLLIFAGFFLEGRGGGGGGSGKCVCVCVCVCE